MAVRARRLATFAGLAATLILCGFSALCVAPAALARTTTTVPGKTIQVYFIFTDKKLVVGVYREGPGGANDLFLGTAPQRGDYGIFYVLNRGHKTHSLSFMKKTYNVKPGKKAHFAAALLRRGAFAYSSPTNPGKLFRGVFLVN